MMRKIGSGSICPVQSILSNSMKPSFTILHAEEGPSERMKRPFEATIFR